MARRHRKKEKKKKLFNKKNLLGIFIVAIMVLSGVGYMVSDQNGGAASADYNGHKFISQNYMWYTDIDGRFVGFSNHPADLESIEAGDMLDYIKNSKMIYIVFDPDSPLVSEFEVVRMELEREFDEFFSIYPVTAVTKESPDYAAFQTISCANATVFLPVLYFKEGNETKIISGGPCITFQSRDRYDVKRLKDRLMYAMFGIID